MAGINATSGSTPSTRLLMWTLLVVYIFNFLDRQIVNILLDLDTPIIGGDVVELNPTRDINGMTAVVAAKLVKEAGCDVIHPSGAPPFMASLPLAEMLLAMR